MIPEVVKLWVLAGKLDPRKTDLASALTLMVDVRVGDDFFCSSTNLSQTPPPPSFNPPFNPGQQLHLSSLTYRNLTQLENT